MMKFSLPVCREESFSDWYQAIIREADLAEVSPVRGCMIMKPWGYGIWELIQAHLDRRIKETGHENCYFPLFIPMSFIAEEANHVDGFAKEMAVVTHHRLKTIGGVLKPDPEARLEEPLIVRPTSETIIGDAYSRWIQSYRDLPVLMNQWSNVVRWEMRPRLFLRTSEFLWQEGHTAHAKEEEAMHETLQMLEVYRELSENILSVPVIAGEKPENERFPGAVKTYSIEAMMQDGKALQAGTSHYLGTNFSKAQNIRYTDEKGDLLFCHTTSWGVSTRLIGGVIMTHGDDDGLRLPPAIAPYQIILIPIVRGKPEDGEVLAFCEKLRQDLMEKRFSDQPVRVYFDRKPVRPVDKKWNWIKKGAPLILEIGPRDIQSNSLTFLRRDRLRQEDQLISQTQSKEVFVAQTVSILEDIQKNLLEQAQQRRDDRLILNLCTFSELKDYFAQVSEDKNTLHSGWAQMSWSRPTGAKLEALLEALKPLKLTLRNIPLTQFQKQRPCFFTGERSVEDILIARSY